LAGGSPQSGGECHQSGGKKNDKKAVMLVDKINQPAQTDKEGAVKVATVLGILAFYGLAACFGYWVAGRQR
jgi:hypothetical protein